MPLPPITIDIFILIAFFLLNIIVGFCYRGRKQSFRAYAIGDKKFSTATLTATLVATWMSGGALFINIEKIHQQGLYYGIPDIIATPVQLLIIGYIIGPRMGKFLNNLSVPDALGKLYGKPVQAIAGITTLLRSTGYVAIQFHVIATILATIFDYEGPEVVIIAALVITLYALFGGVKAVTFTDVLQFFTFGTLLPILALTVWNNLQDSTRVTHMFQTNPLFSLKEVLSWSPQSINALLFMAYLMAPTLGPQLFQRMVMARDTVQIKRSFGYAAIICLGIELCMVWIAIMMKADQPGLAPSKIMSYIISTHTYPGFKGLLGMGIIALSMSTADSVLNACAVIVANDILPVAGLQKQNSLRAARWATLVLGMLGLVLVLNTKNLVQVLVGAAHFYVPMVTPAPILLTIFGFRTSRKVVLMAMGAGATATLACHLYFTSVHSFLPGALANLVTMVGLHYLLGEQGGWQRLAPNDPLNLERAARRQRWKWRLKAIRSFRLYPYLQQNLPTQEGFYFLFGLYTIAATYAAFYTIGDADVKTYQALYRGIYYTVLPATTAFLTFPVWPTTIKSHRFMAYFWPLSIAGILFFAGTLLVIMSRFHHMQVMMINLLMAVLLLRWPLAIFLSCTGTYTAFIFFTRYTGSPIPVSTLGAMQMLYLILIFTSLALIGKQAYRHLVKSNARLSKEHSSANQLILTMFQHSATVLQEASDCSLTEDKIATKLKGPAETFYAHPTKEQLSEENKTLYHSVYQLDTYNRYLKQTLHRTQHPVRLEVQTATFDVPWQKALEAVLQHKETANAVITQHHTACQQLQADITGIQQLLHNALIYTDSQQRNKQPILLGFEDTQLAYPIMAIPGYIKHIKAVRMTITTAQKLPKLKKWYLGNIDYAALAWPQDIAALPITYNQQIVEAHYGYTEMSHSPGDITLLYIVPWDVREVRPPVMDQWKMPAATKILASATHPSETAFVKAVQAKTPMEPRLLQQALQFIKQYYGQRTDDTGELYSVGAIAVAQITMDCYTRDPDTLLAAMLHNIVDKTHCSLHQIALYFNPVIQRIVDGVACVDSRLKSSKKIQLSNFETIRKLLEIQDDRVFYIKLASQLHNMRMIQGHLSLAKQKSIAEETLQFFVPMAERLGLSKVAEELKKHCFAVFQRKQ